MSLSELREHNQISNLRHCATCFFYILTVRICTTIVGFTRSVYLFEMDKTEKWVKCYNYSDEGLLYFVRKVNMQTRVECKNCYAIYAKSVVEHMGFKNRCPACGVNY